MKALLLAAGFGTRLRPITEQIPKCLVPIRNKPLLSYWLELLLTNGIDHVLINTHYLSELVHDYVSASSFRDAITLVHETDLLGTAGTVLKNHHFLANEAFLLAHADNLTRFSVAEFMKAHRQRKPGVEITMMTFTTDMPQSCGIVELDKSDVVIGFHEKPATDYGTKANAAVYIVEPSVLNYLQSLGKEEIDFSTEVLPHYIGRMQAYHNSDYHRDIGTLKSLQLAEAEY